jgi:hypothetical protein
VKTPISLALGLLAMNGCSPYALSPPATTVPIESSKALNKGEWGLQGEVGGGGEYWGPNLFSAAVRARHGLGHGLEFALQGNVVRVGNNADGWTSSAHQGIYSARLGLKYEVATPFALMVGIGGGGSAGGGFVSPDFGAILAWENPKFVPIITAGGFFSKPIRAQEIRFTSDDGDFFAGAPDPTLGWFCGLGFRVPVVHDHSPATKPAFVFGFRTVGAAHDEPDFGLDARYHNVYFVGTFGFEYIFGGDRKPRSVAPHPSPTWFLKRNGSMARRALGKGSLAIDQIPKADCRDADGAPLTTDQRGEPRPETGGTTCHVGSFEVQP